MLAFKWSWAVPERSGVVPGGSRARIIDFPLVLRGFLGGAPRSAHADCAVATKGMLRLATPADCLRHLITRCPRARFASISVSERDCSWYTSCTVKPHALRQSGLGHRSFVLNNAVRRAVAATMPPPHEPPHERRRRHRRVRTRRGYDAIREL